MSDFIEVASRGGIRTITLNRPDKINALTSGMMGDLARAVRAADARSERMIVLTGNGPKGFCAGADLKEFRLGASQIAAQCDALLELVEAFTACTVPSLCRIHGRTLGGGGMIASLSTIVLAEADTLIGFPEIHLGMFPAIVYEALTERLAPALAFQLCLSGRLLSAAEGQSIGLVTEIIAPGSGDERIGYYVERAAAVAAGRRVARSDSNLSVIERVRQSIPLFVESLSLSISPSDPRGGGN